MRILICDDDPIAAEQIQKNLKSFFTCSHAKYSEIVTYSNGEDLLKDTGNKDLYHRLTFLLPVETKDSVYTVSSSDIICIEAIDRKVLVHTLDTAYESIHNMAL